MAPSSKQAKKKINIKKIIIPLIIQSVIFILAIILICFMHIGKITLDTQIHPIISFLVYKFYGLETFYFGLFLLITAIIFCISLRFYNLKSQCINKLIKYSEIIFSILISGKLWAYSTLLGFFYLAPHYVTFIQKPKTHWLLIITFSALAVSLTLYYPYICKKIIYRKRYIHKKKT